MEVAAEVDASADIMGRLDRLAGISQSPDHLARRCYTAEHRAANDLAAMWMREAGMAVREDALGNLIGRYEGARPGVPAILLGSHLDTVIDAGRYDGGLGVVCAIESVRSLKARGIRFDCAIEVAGFADEEGVRFQSTYLGSRGVAGTFDTGLLDRTDGDGVSLAQAMRDFGLDPARIGEAARRPEDLVCYLEIHIEQGPVLEEANLAVGAVTAIAGANRMTVTVEGDVGHAGTVPMAARRDALAAASACVLAVEEVAARHAETVGTVGQLQIPSGATNVIPGRVVFSVDLRAAADSVRRNALDAVRARFDQIARRRGARISVEDTHAADSVACAPWLIDKIEGAMTELGHRPFRLPSGAGHDAAAMAQVTDIGMIFTRCAGGVSHSPEESITAADAAASADLLRRTVEIIAVNYRRPRP